MEEEETVVMEKEWWSVDLVRSNLNVIPIPLPSAFGLAYVSIIENGSNVGLGSGFQV